MANVLKVVLRPGTDVQPISFARVLQRVGGQSLATAKANLNRFAEQREVLIDFDNEPTRDAVASELRLLGAECTPEPPHGAADTPTEDARDNAAVETVSADAGSDVASERRPLALKPAMTSTAAWQTVAWAGLVLGSMLLVRLLRSSSEPSTEELHASLAQLQARGALDDETSRDISPAQKAANARIAAHAENLRRLYELYDGGQVAEDAGVDADE